jgi:hypothetical protein
MESKFVSYLVPVDAITLKMIRSWRRRLQWIFDTKMPLALVLEFGGNVNVITWSCLIRIR